MTVKNLANKKSLAPPTNTISTTQPASAPSTSSNNVHAHPASGPTLTLNAPVCPYQYWTVFVTNITGLESLARKSASKRGVTGGSKFGTRKCATVSVTRPAEKPVQWARD